MTDSTPMTYDDLIAKHGSPGRAAGALALGVEQIDGRAFMRLPESFLALVAYKQALMITRLTAIAAGSSIQRLHHEWHAHAGDLPV